MTYSIKEVTIFIQTVLTPPQKSVMHAESHKETL